MGDLGGPGADHIQGGVGQSGQRRPIAQQTAGGRVQDHVVGLLPQGGEKGFQAPGLHLSARIGRRLIPGQQADLRPLQRQQVLPGICAPEVQQLRRPPGGDAHPQAALDGGLAQIQVHQNDPRAVLAEGQGQVDSHGGLSLAGKSAGDHDHLAPLGRPEELDAQATYILQESAGYPGVLDGDGTVELPGAPFEPHGGQGGKACLIESTLDLLRRADSAPGRGEEQHDRQPQGKAQQRALADAAYRIKRGVGLGGHRRLGQNVHLSAAHHVIGHPGINADDRLQDVVGVLGAGAGDPEGEKACVVHRPGRDAAVEPAHSQLLPEQGLKKVGLQQIGEGLGQLFGRGFVIITAAPGHVAEGGRAGLDGEGGFGVVERHITPPGTHPHRGGAQQRQQQRHPEQAAQGPSQLRQKAVQINPALFLIQLMFFHGDSPPGRTARLQCPPHRLGLFGPRFGHNRIRIYSRIHTHIRSHSPCGRWRRACCAHR